MIIVYITCKNKKEAEKMGLAILKKRLAACVMVSSVQSAYFWPPKSGKIERTKKALLIAKTQPKLYEKLEREVRSTHLHSIPAILALPVRKANNEYVRWLNGELRHV